MPYHRALADYLQSHYTDLWNGLATEQWEQEHANAVLLELNRTSKVQTEDSAPELFEILNSVKAALGMEAVTVTLWEVPEGDEFPNSSVFWVSDEAHLAVKKSHNLRLIEAEREKLLRTELIRWKFLDGWDGRFRYAERLLRALLNSSRQDGAAIRESWKRWNEATNAFANRTDETGGPEGTTEFVNGPLRWEQLDLLERQKVAEVTRQLIRRLLCPVWFQTPAILAHARLFFSDLTPEELATATENKAAAIEISLDDPELKDYFCYVLLDFASADRELGEKAFAECLKLARELSCESRFLEVIAEELEWTPEEIETLAAKTPADHAQEE